MMEQRYTQQKTIHTPDEIEHKECTARDTERADKSSQYVFNLCFVPLAPQPFTFISWHSAIAIYKYKHQIQGHIVSKSVFFTVHFFLFLDILCVFFFLLFPMFSFHSYVLLNRTQKPLFPNSSRFFLPFKNVF